MNSSRQIIRPFKLFIVGFSRLTWIRRVEYGREEAKSGITTPSCYGKDKEIKTLKSKSKVIYSMPIALGVHDKVHDKVLDNDPDRFGIYKFCFFRKLGKPKYPEKNLSGKDKNQQQTQPIYDVKCENRTRTTLVGGECSHHCSIPAPLSLSILRTVPTNTEVFLRDL